MKPMACTVLPAGRVSTQCKNRSSQVGNQQCSNEADGLHRPPCTVLPFRVPEALENQRRGGPQTPTQQVHPGTHRTPTGHPKTGTTQTLPTQPHQPSPTHPAPCRQPGCRRCRQHTSCSRHSTMPREQDFVPWNHYIINPTPLQDGLHGLTWPGSVRICCTQKPALSQVLRLSAQAATTGTPNCLNSTTTHCPIPIFGSGSSPTQPPQPT